MIGPPVPILITRSAGFVGRHNVHQLSKRGYRVRALVRRIPPQPFDPSVEVVTGDLNHPETYRNVLETVSTVVHAAHSEELLKEPHITSTLVNGACGQGYADGFT